MSEAYKQAVRNLEAVVKEHRSAYMLNPKQMATLQFDIFLLKMQPQYTGILPKEKE